MVGSSTVLGIRFASTLYSRQESVFARSLLSLPLTFIEPFYVAVAPLLEDHFLLFNLTRALLAGLVVLVPATLMGGTVPAMARFSYS